MIEGNDDYYNILLIKYLDSDLESVKSNIKNHPHQPNKKNKDGTTLFMQACFGGNKDVAEYIIDNDYVEDYNKADKNKFTPITYAMLGLCHAELNHERTQMFEDIINKIYDKIGHENFINQKINTIEYLNDQSNLSSLPDDKKQKYKELLIIFKSINLEQTHSELIAKIKTNPNPNPKLNPEGGARRLPVRIRNIRTNVFVSTQKRTRRNMKKRNTRRRRRRV